VDYNREYVRVSGRESSLAADFMNKVYRWMTLGLVITGAVGYLVSSSGTIMNMLFGGGMVLFFVLALVELGMVWFLSARVMTLSPSTSSMLFLGYSALNGVTIAPLLAAYTGASVAQAFFISAGLFGGMSVYGTVTKRDLSSFGSFLMMGLWGIIIASVVNLFIGSAKMGLVVSIIAVLVFTGLAAYDTYKLRVFAAESGMGEEDMEKISICGALSLYLDFVNIFIQLLRIMGTLRER
jgi:FtsH-binding integral membrane protein